MESSLFLEILAEKCRRQRPRGAPELSRVFGIARWMHMYTRISPRALALRRFIPPDQQRVAMCKLLTGEFPSSYPRGELALW